MTEEEKEKLQELLHEYQDVISSDELYLGLTDLVEHCIETGDAKPCRQALRRTPAAYAHIVDEQVQLMLKQGIIFNLQCLIGVQMWCWSKRKTIRTGSAWTSER